MAEPLIESLGAPCEICGLPGHHLPYEGHLLCPYCTLLGCPECWRGIVSAKWARFRLRSRMVCPACGWKGAWRR